MASIERYGLARRDEQSRVRYRVRYRDPDGRPRGETFMRREDAVHRRSETASMRPGTRST